MAVRTGDLLVQSGIVSPRRMAEAHQRQVIYGGALDTVLLEADIRAQTPAQTEA